MDVDWNYLNIRSSDEEFDDYLANTDTNDLINYFNFKKKNIIQKITASNDTTGTSETKFRMITHFIWDYLATLTGSNFALKKNIDSKYKLIRHNIYLQIYFLLK
jgi:hypothetical protein